MVKRHLQIRYHYIDYNESKFDIPLIRCMMYVWPLCFISYTIAQHEYSFV